MAEIVPNRVPCGKRPEPTPTPQPQPTPVTLCDLTGVKYFKLQSDIPGDYTKNCGLLGNEIDENFYFLRSMDIKTAYTIDKEDKKILVLERVNCGRDIRVDITDIEEPYQFEFKDGYIVITFPDGHEEKMGKFLVEGDNIRVVTDASITGDGSYRNPLSLDLAYRTGTYMPADFYADLTCPEETINQFENIGNGHAIVTKENMSRFGFLYTLRQAMAINAALEKEGRGWRVPSKEDWAKLLNWAELDPSPCDDCGELPKNFNHDTDKSGNFGCNAGARLKTTTLWENKERNTDDFGFSIYPVGICPEDYNTAEPNQFGFTGLYKVASFWTSSEKDGEGYVRTFSYGHDDVAQYTESPVRRLSIRLVRDIDDDFDVQESAEILGNYVPVILTTNGTQQWTQLNISITNYEGYDPNEVTVPDEWKKINTDIPTVIFYQLSGDSEEYYYVEIDEYDMPSTASPVFYDSVEEAMEQDEPDQYIAVEEIIILDMTTEPKFYFNAWDGNRWHKKMMREGESIVIVGEDAETNCDTAATPYVTSANTNHEWRVYMNPQTGLDELVDVAEALKGEMNNEFKEIHELISGLTENIQILSGFVGDMYDEMQSGFTSAFTAIDDLQKELDRVEEGVGLDEDGNYITPENGLTSASTSVMDAIAILDSTILEDEEVVAASLNDLNRRMINLSGVVGDMQDAFGGLQEELDNVENAIGLDDEGNHIPNEGNYTSSAETVEGEIAALDDALKEVSDDVEELKEKTIEPLDKSIVVEVSGNTTYVGVKLDSEDKHIKLGENGLWFDGEFKLDDEVDEDFYEN